MAALKNLWARWISWRAQWRSQRKRSHRYRQQSAGRRYYTLSEISGQNAGETFARRIAYLRKLDPLVFEEMVLDAFQRKGFLIERGTRYSGDGGLDGKVFKENCWYGIQCKRYKDAIHTAHVERFAQDLTRFGLQKGYFVHTGKTPAKLRNQAGPVMILSGQALIDFLL